MQEAVSVEQGQCEFSELDLPDKATLLDVCGSRVVIDENSNTVRLTHYTVQEHLLKNHVIPDDADFKLAMVCLTFFS